MSTDRLRLVLAELEVEVVREALELYLLARPVPNDRRFEYRYRAAQSVLESLRHGTHELGPSPQVYEGDPNARDDDRTVHRSNRERIED